jgi:hypothetical protein
MLNAVMVLAEKVGGEKRRRILHRFKNARPQTYVHCHKGLACTVL